MLGRDQLKVNFETMFDHYEKIDNCIQSCAAAEQIQALETMVKTFEARWKVAQLMPTETLVNSLTRKIQKVYEKIHHLDSNADSDDSISPEGVQS